MSFCHYNCLIKYDIFYFCSKYCFYIYYKFVRAYNLLIHPKKQGKCFQIRHNTMDIPNWKCRLEFRHSWRVQ